MKIPHALVGTAAAAVAALGFLFPVFALAATVTHLSAVNETAVYGGTVTLQATLTNSSHIGIPGKTVDFTVSLVPVGHAVTDGSGTATLTGVPLSVLLGVGTHNNFIGAAYLGGGGFIGSLDTANLTITQKSLTVTGITASPKNYDGTESATIDTSGATLVGVVSPDHITLNTAGATGAFLSAGPGLGETVQVSGLTISGSHASDYSLVQPTATADITVACSLTPSPSNFDSFTLGSVDGQGGWAGTSGGAISPLYDQAIVTNTLYPTFGCKSLRISNAVTSGSFGDWIFSPSTVNEAGESDAINNGYSGGVRQNHFVAQFDIGSATATYQPGAMLAVSPDRGDGARMSFLRFEDRSDGVHVFFDDYSEAIHDFVETDITAGSPVGPLDRTKAHTVKFDMTFVDGPSNDVVEVYIDGVLAHTGTSWEDYFHDNQPSIAPPTVDSLLFREGGSVSADPSALHGGFLIDNLSLTSSTINGNLDIKTYQCPAGTTVTRAANGVGLTVPAGCTPKQGTIFGYVHGTQIDANSPYPEFGHTFTVLGTTDSNGTITASLPAEGRYLIAETDGSGNQLPPNAPLGLYCTGDAGVAGANDN